MDTDGDQAMDSCENLKAENWEMVDEGTTVKSIVSSEGSIGSDSEKGKFLGDSQDFQYVHAKAVAQIDQADQVLQNATPLPVSTELHASDVQIISDGSLSGFSSPGKSVHPDGSAEFEAVLDNEQCHKQASGTLEVLGEGSMPGSDMNSPFPEKQVPPHELKDDPSAKSVSSTEAFNDEKSAATKGLFHWLLHQWTALVRDWPLKGILSLYFRPIRAVLGKRDWNGLARNAGVALLSAMALGLFVRNRKLAYELKKKHEEVTRLMVTLMNFQELWNSNRSNGPVLRHTGISLHLTF